MPSEDARCTLRSALFVLAVVMTAACGSTSSTAVTGPSAIRCEVSLSGPVLLPAAASQAVIRVTSDRECAWNAATDASWLVPTPRSGVGSLDVTLTAEANGAPVPRSGTLTVARQPFTVTQAGVVIPPIFSAGLSARSTLLVR